MELAGRWKAKIADDDLRRDGTGLDVDDGDWADVDVPGHWRHHPDLATAEGPVLYRRRFELPAPEPGRRRWVTLSGIFYQADVFLDGAYLGDPEGYFFPHSFDITALSRLGRDHVLAVEVTCQPERGVSGRRNITGLLQHSEAVSRTWNPGGLWAPVLVYDTGPAKLDRLRVLCRDADDTRAHVRVTARIESDVARTVELRTSADDVLVAAAEHPLAAGTNEISWTLDLDHPRLWWPRSLGEQPLTEIGVEVLVDGECSDRRVRRTGLREVAVNEWQYTINGERLFLKGVNLLPTRPGLADADPAEVRRDVELALAAGLDAARVQAHIGRPELYDAADELGLLLLQDFPLEWGYARSVRREAVRQAREAVDALGHHPSIIQWTAHDEPIAEAPQLEGVPTRRQRLQRALAINAPTWNRSVLDRWVKRAFEQADPTRPVVAHGGLPPSLPRLDGTDAHLWLGWHRGEIDDLTDRARRLPRSVRFVSEFGAQSVPDDVSGILDPATWPDVDVGELVADHGVEWEVMVDRHPPAASPTFAAWRAATQRYQARLLRRQIEILRRLKYRPVGGFTFSVLADPAPMISAAVLDHKRRPKLAWAAVIEACRPLIVVVDPLPPTLPAGGTLAQDLHVVNDLHDAVSDATVSVTATWRRGQRTWTFRGDVAADGCELVGRIELDLPDEPGDLLLGIAFTGRAADGTTLSYARRDGTRIT